MFDCTRIIIRLRVNTGAEAYQLQRDEETQTQAQTQELLYKKKFLFKILASKASLVWLRISGISHNVVLVFS